MPRVCIVIVNWNGKDLVRKALQSVFQINYKDYDVVVVDNASTDDSVEAIKHSFPKVTVIVNEKNLGGTGGFNTGMRYVLTKSYKYTWLVDNDVVVDRDSLLQLVEVMEKDCNIGIAGSKILQQENPSIVWEVGVKMDWDNNNRILLNQNMTDYNNDCNVYEVDHVAACSLLARTNCLKSVGLMDENYFWGLDDVDWCLSFKEKGYKVVAVSKSRIWHPQFEEKGKGEITKRDYFVIRNWLYLVKKHTRGFQRARSMQKSLSDIFRRLLMYRINNNLYAEKILSLAIKDFLLGRFGGMIYDYDKSISAMKSGLKPENNILDMRKLNFKKILIYPFISISKVKEVVNTIKQDLPDAEIHFLIEENRKQYVIDIGVDEVIPFPITGKSKIMKLLELRKNNYDLGLCNIKTFSDIDIPRKIARYDNNQFYEVGKINMVNELIRIGLSAVLGNILSLFFLPFCLSKKFSTSKQSRI